MDAAFLRAARPKSRTALGLELSPLTLGHLFVLRKYDSCFIVGKPLSLSDLVFSVFICSQPYDKSERDLKKWWVGWFVRWWAARTRRLDKLEETVKFITYLEESKAFPKTKRDMGVKAGRKHEITSPPEWTYLVMLVREFGLSIVEAKSMQMVEATAMLAALGDLRGTLEFRTELDEAHWEAARKLDDEKFGARN